MQLEHRLSSPVAQNVLHTWLIVHAEVAAEPPLVWGVKWGASEKLLWSWWMDRGLSRWSSSWRWNCRAWGLTGCGRWNCRALGLTGCCRWNCYCSTWRLTWTGSCWRWNCSAGGLTGWGGSWRWNCNGWRLSRWGSSWNTFFLILMNSIFCRGNKHSNLLQHCLSFFLRHRSCQHWWCKL